MKLLRYGMASLGPVGSAGAQFLLSLVLLHILTAKTFGSFAFLLVASQLGASIWSALFCAPLLIVLTQDDRPDREDRLRAIFALSLLLALVAAGIFAAIGLELGLSLRASVLFSAYVAVSLLRWFARAHAYAAGRPLRTMASDLLYTAVLLGGVGLLFVWGSRFPDLAYLALLVSVLVGLLPFGAAYFRAQFLDVSLRDLPRYREIWRQHASWSLLGVVTTEATINCHTYIVTLIYGPAAFAPIAATSLLIRPIMVAINALSEFERAQMGRLIGECRIADASRSVRMFRTALLGIWVLTAAASIILLWLAPRLVFPPRYTMAVLVLGCTLWMVVALARVLRTPESALLQAAGEFRALAWASIYASGFSIAAVCTTLLLAGPLWSIAGIVMGELFFIAWLWSATRRWVQGGGTLPRTSSWPARSLAEARP